MKNIFSWLSKKKPTDVVDAQALVADLLCRLDAQDQQMYRMERALEDQAKRVDKVIKRIDQATGRGVV